MYLKPYKYQFLAVFLAAVLSTVFNIFSPKILGQATTKLFEGIMLKAQGIPGARVDFDFITQILITLVFLYLFSSLFSYIQQYIMAGVAQKTVYNLRKEINSKLSRLPLKYFDAQKHGEILSRAINDVDNISTTLQQSLVQITTSVVTLVGITVMMLTISPVITLVLIVTLPLSFIVTMFIASRSQKYFMGQQGALGELNGHVEEMYTGHQVIKAFGHEDKSVQQFKEINEKLYNSGWKAQLYPASSCP
ncbi:hypothetical protein N752_08335 [Desulforamulus aquiferis]|nr:hypothetical protein N752_08335 [Desulforamulus aquiferis]